MSDTHTNGHVNGNGVLHNKPVEQVIRSPDRKPSPQPTHLSVPGTSNHSRVLSEQGSGYEAPKFEGKTLQMEEVMDKIEAKGFLPPEFVETETQWFYNELGIDDMYFSTETSDAIVSHIHSLYAAKVAAFARDDKQLEIRLDKEAADHAVFIDTSKPGITSVGGPRYEQRIDEKYLNNSKGADSYRVETFRSSSKLPGDLDQKLRCYFVYQCSFEQPNPGPDETRLDMISDKRFLQKATQNTRDIYQHILESAVARTGPVIELFEIKGSREKRLVIAYKQGSALGLFSALSDLYHYYGLTSSRKYVEQFSNGYTIMSLYLRPVPGPESNTHPPIEASIHQIMKEVSLLYCVPRTKFQNHFAVGTLSLQETIYAHCVWVFVSHFLNRLGSEYNTLSAILDPNNSVHAELLAKLKRRLRTETFTSDFILEIMQMYPELVKVLYLNFANTHYVQTRGDEDDFLPTLSYLRLKVDKVLTDSELKNMISTTCQNEHQEMVMTAFRTFNKAVLKTNYYTPTKTALSFRLNPSFLPIEEYPQPLYGMFLIIGSEFRGFHLRFRDIARGGIRIVKSRSPEAYDINARSLFDENYNLANTQQRKNKDIPEGGSKGVILLDVEHQEKASEKVAFEKYIDSILDLLLPPTSPGIKDPIVDLHGKQEILFLGPDENTAHLVDWATEHARSRNAPWWKSFFTGKSPKLGGIPHDEYGMTTLSVREYVLGIYRKLNLDQNSMRKLQTGGPDGDLGSNEILLGNEKYTAIVDGAGVLVDPNGIDRDELLRLAKERVMIHKFDASKLSPQGYRVLIEDNNVTLPSGEVVKNGTAFRNAYHLRAETYDVFVPCGGRPESINLNSVNKLIVDGKSIIPYIVEGANLFITQDAKLRLEKAGCILFKDASANKGGVTSSSLEVLASLSFDNEGFIKNMCVGEDGTTPEFYKAYVKQVQDTIRNNARLEFEAIWRESEATGTPKSILSDTLSTAITNLDEELQNTELWDNVELRKSVLQDALPSLLLEKIGLDLIIERVPENYLRAIFGSYLSSRFIYERGISASQFAFFSFMNERMAKLRS
ncbi:NAD-dependent glutamate dehydrogenase [Aureobasidium pullulans]|uniref:NAD-specific glutamate dehydrogenase n=2 Tax=Aureobasidium pullulans TaxID=5580 RepID=A0A074XE55_AURPU|nr:NAD-dependent glutamate dehydrogenase [Aureobasidium pullulans EXF-150]KEQ82009.1 NAD-dependent glutamate dehydrogenase [Aureobasidium pullulans EXF-150]THY61966.1 NAD-dependent glutamate dehydrogenase [Aureobasidium pullulans]THZ50782.1 NAD-dependent glutamate dehydrogenase [Aureobasidium pullulans]TIA65224.1 NAD-dependent glutamate dehydrogenase [Aureobasidium pullulans]